jgi:hypothetical protein
MSMKRMAVVVATLARLAAIALLIPPIALNAIGIATIKSHYYA